MDPKEKRPKSLDIEELADIRGGTSISGDCPDKGTSKCTENPYNCGTQDENKNLCPYSYFFETEHFM